MAKHDENQDIRILSKRFKISEGRKTIYATKGQVIGNKTWGRLDYLCHYCGYTLVWGADVVVDKNNFDSSEKKKKLREAKKAAKQPKLTNKNKKPSNKK